MSSPIEKLKAEIQKSVKFDVKAAIGLIYNLGYEEGDMEYDVAMIAMHVQHAKSAKMASQLLEAIQVIEFYASNSIGDQEPFTWNCRKPFMFDMICEDDLEEIAEHGTFIKGKQSKKYILGGKKAREFLAKLSKGSET